MARVVDAAPFVEPSLFTMNHDLVLDGPAVALRPLDVTDAADLVAVTLDSDDVAGDLRWHTSPLPVDEDTAPQHRGVGREPRRDGVRGGRR